MIVDCHKVGITLLAMVFLALYNGFIRWATIQNSVWTINLWVGIICLLVISTTAPLFYKDLLKVKIRELAPLGAMGIFQTITNFAFATTMTVNISISSVITSIPFSMIFAVLFSIFAPKLLEKHPARIYVIRFTAATVMIYSALQLSR